MTVNYIRRYCSIAKCKTGRVADRTKRKKLGLRQLSLFRVTKDLSLREKWSEILGQTVTEKDAICELHFSLDSIDKYHETQLPNGMVQRIKRVRHYLKPQALPLSEKREPTEEKDDSPAENEMPTYSKLEIPGSHSLIIQLFRDGHDKLYENYIHELHALSQDNLGFEVTIDPSDDEIIELTDSNSVNFRLENNSLQNDTCNLTESSVEVSEGSDCNYQPNVTDKNIDNAQNTDIEILAIQTNPQNDHCYYLPTHKIQNSCAQINQEENVLNQNTIEQTLDPIKIVSTSHISQNNFQKMALPQQKEVYNNPSRKQHTVNRPVFKMPLKTNPNINISTSNVHQKHCNTEERVLVPIDNAPALQKNQPQKSCKKQKIAQEVVARPFDLNAIRDYFDKNALPKSWTWIENKTYDTIIFVQINRVTQQIRCYVECRKDLSMNVFTFDRLKISKFDGTVVKSTDDILNLLLKVYSLRLCEACSVDEKRLENCSILLSEEDMYKRKSPVDKCFNCRNVKKPKSKLNLSSFNEPSRSVPADSNKNRDLPQKLQQMTKSCEYYREKCNHMKEMIENLKKICTTVQNTATKTALTEAISELPSSQQEVVRACFDHANMDPRARRYDVNYAHECFLLKEVSEAAYEHIKQRNLLPLPCKTTLNAIVGGKTKT